MPRQASGPRLIDSSGTYYAVKVVKGRRHTLSLGTKNKAEAARLWPAAMEQLEASLGFAPKMPGPHLMWDPDTGKSWVEGSPWTPEELGHETPGLSWEEATEVAAKRRERRTGRPVSDSWRDAVKQALRYTHKGPEELSATDVRAMVLKMEAAGLGATTVAQRCAVLSGVLVSLIRTGTCPDLQNPFERVDTAASPINHHATATPSDYKTIWQQLSSIPEDMRDCIRILIYSGARVSEVLNAAYEGQWMQIKETPDWRPKNRVSRRDVPLPERLVHHLSRGGMPTAGNLRRYFNKITPDHITPHSLRHGYKTAARIAGADEYVTERLLGHAAGSRMSMTYGEYPQELLLREAQKVWSVLDSWVA